MLYNHWRSPWSSETSPQATWLTSQTLSFTVCSTSRSCLSHHQVPNFSDLGGQDFQSMKTQRLAYKTHPQSTLHTWNRSSVTGIWTWHELVKNNLRSAQFTQKTVGRPSLDSSGRRVVYEACTELIKNLRYRIFFPHEYHIQPLSPLLSYVFIAILFLLYPTIQHASRDLRYHFHVQTTHGLLLSHARKGKAIIYKGSTTLKHLQGEKLRIMGGEEGGMHITNPKLN